MEKSLYVGTLQWTHLIAEKYELLHYVPMDFGGLKPRLQNIPNWYIS